MILRVAGELADMLCELDEAFVLDTRARWAGNDIQSAEVGHGAEAALANILQYRMADADLFVLTLVREGQGDADRVPDPATDELLERDTRLDLAIG